MVRGVTYSMRKIRRRTYVCFLATALLLSGIKTVRAQTISFTTPSTDFGSLNVCPSSTSAPVPCSKTLTIPFTVAGSGTLGAPKVLTLGVPDLDFTLAADSCRNGVISGQQCTAEVTFAPRFPGGRAGAFQITDASGHVLATEYLGGQGLGPQAAFGQTGVKPTVTAILDSPEAIAIDGAHNLYAALLNVPYLVEVPFGCTDVSCQVPIGAGLTAPSGLSLDGAGSLYVLVNNRTQIMKIPAGCQQTTCETFVGGTFNHVNSIALDRVGNLYLADTAGNEVLRAAPGCDNNQCLFAISSATPYPTDIAVDGPGNVYVTDGNGIEKIPAGGGPKITLAPAGNTSGLAVDAAGNVFFNDQDTVSGFYLIQELTPEGAVRTLATPFEGGAPLVVDSMGNIFFLDFDFVSPQPGGYAVREIVRGGPTPYTFADAIVGTQSSDSPQTLSVENSGNTPLTLSITPPDASSFMQTAGAGAAQQCSIDLSLKPGERCDVSVSFIPATVGAQSGSALVTDNSLNLPGSVQTASYTGTGVNFPTSTPANFPNGFTGVTASSLSLNHGASVRGRALVLTDGGTNEARSAFLPDRVDITSFETSFDFQLSGRRSRAPDASGFMFVLQSLGPNAVGSAGGGLGFGLRDAAEAVEFTQHGTIPVSVGVKFDLYSNAGEGSSSTGVYLNGAPPTTPSVDLLPSGIDLHSGHIFHTTIHGGGNGLTLTIEDQSTGATFSRFFAVDLPGTLLGSTGYVGFTAGTGSKSAVQRILYWTYTSTSLTPATNCPTNSPCFPNGFNGAAGLVFNGAGSSVAGPVLNLISGKDQASSTYFAQPMPAHHFTTDFDFRFKTNDADGFAFVAQSQGSSALGSAGGGLGYGRDTVAPCAPFDQYGNPVTCSPTITNSLAIKYDLHNNQGEGYDSTGSYVDGASPTTPFRDLTAARIHLHSGHTFHARIAY